MTPQEMLQAADELEARAERLRLKTLYMRQKYPWARWVFEITLAFSVRTKARAAALRREAKGEFRF